MRRTVLLLATMALTLLVASGVALAVVKMGGPGHDTLIGTKGPDTLSGAGGRDRIEGRSGSDLISGGLGSDGNLDGGWGADVISGGPGGDRLIDGPWSDSSIDTLDGGAGSDTTITYNFPAARDIISCGAGRDYASVDRKDIVGDDCETVELVQSSGGPID